MFRYVQTIAAIKVTLPTRRRRKKRKAIKPSEKSAQIYSRMSRSAAKLEEAVQAFRAGDAEGPQEGRLAHRAKGGLSRHARANKNASSLMLDGPGGSGQFVVEICRGEMSMDIWKKRPEVAAERRVISESAKGKEKKAGEAHPPKITARSCSTAKVKDPTSGVR